MRADASLILSLDLADVYSKRGKTNELRQVIAEATRIFRAMRLGREVLASLLLQRAIPSEASRVIAEGT